MRMLSIPTSIWYPAIRKINLAGSVRCLRGYSIRPGTKLTAQRVTMQMSKIGDKK